MRASGSRGEEIAIQCSNPHANSGADKSGIPAVSFALGFVALICATVVGYEFTSKGDQRNLTDYGYVEELDDPQAHRSPAGIAAATCPAASAALSGQRVDGARGAGDETIFRWALGPPACSQPLGRMNNRWFSNSSRAPSILIALRDTITAN